MCKSETFPIQLINLITGFCWGGEVLKITLVLFLVCISFGCNDTAKKTSQFSAKSEVDPPTIISKSPVENESNVSLLSTIQIVFSEAMDASTINEDTFNVYKVLPDQVKVRVQYDKKESNVLPYNEKTRSVRFKPEVAFDRGSIYLVEILADVANNQGVKDIHANVLRPNIENGKFYSWSFTATDLQAPYSLESYSPREGETVSSLAELKLVLSSVTIESAILKPEEVVDDIQVSLASGADWPGESRYNPETRTLVFTPRFGGFPLNSIVNVNVRIKKIVGNDFLNWSWSFNVQDGVFSNQSRPVMLQDGLVSAGVRGPSYSETRIIVDQVGNGTAIWVQSTSGADNIIHS